MGGGWMNGSAEGWDTGTGRQSSSGETGGQMDAWEVGLPGDMRSPGWRWRARWPLPQFRRLAVNNRRAKYKGATLPVICQETALPESSRCPCKDLLPTTPSYHENVLSPVLGRDRWGGHAGESDGTRRQTTCPKAHLRKQ